MLALTRSMSTFPSVSLASHCDGLPVEVALIAQLGHGAGDRLVCDVEARQRGHHSYIDALDEPSARLGGVDLPRGDSTSLYSFTVGPQGHPFHRHAGHRVFTAIAGSGGAQLRFSTASDADVEQDPAAFLRALQFVNLPPDSLFTVRFGGGTWHQFVPLLANSGHPALFALSCHTDELGGPLPDQLREKVLANAADIPSLTQLLPAPVQALLDGAQFDPSRVPTRALSVDSGAVSVLGRVCRLVRGGTGRLRSAIARRRAPAGFLLDNGGGRVVREVAMSAESLLATQLQDGFVHEDMFALATHPHDPTFASASAMLSAVLDGFLENRPLGVSRLMALRNVLVRPLGLRVSPLGCPVSSLLAAQAPSQFAGRFPVIAQRVSADDSRAEVILGADDRHLRFRSCVAVERRQDGSAIFSLGTRVQTHNLFGRFYMAVIDRVHRGYITPAMLRLAVDHALARRTPAALRPTTPGATPAPA